MSIYEYDEERQRRFDKEEGREEGIRKGRELKLADQISKKLRRGKIIPEIAEALEETEEVIKRIIEEYKLSIE